MMSLRIGISSSFTGSTAPVGVKTIINTVLAGKGEIGFILSTRQKGESSATDAVLESLGKGQIPIVCVSAKEHRDSWGKNWRDAYGRNVLEKLAPFLPVDMVFAFGDMIIWPKKMCETLQGVNLHPDLPGRFKGEWYNVIAQIIANKEKEAGAMIHLLTPDLDKGTVITKCSFSLRGPIFDKLWNELPEDQEELQGLIAKQKLSKGNPTHPLWQKIREQGLRREFPLIELTLNRFSEGKLRLEGQKVFNYAGGELREGLDLSEDVDREVRTPEGEFPTGKETRF